MPQRIEVSGLRGFGEPQSLTLAVPDGRPGSGLTLLVGPNGGGKSTLVEAFAHLSGSGTPSFPEGRRNTATDKRVRIHLEIDDRHWAALKTIDPGGSETTWDTNHGSAGCTFYVLPSRRSFETFFGRVPPVERQAYTQQLQQIQRGQSLQHFPSRLMLVQRDPKRLKRFNDFAARVLREPIDWVIDQSDGGQQYVKVRKGHAQHSTEGMGDGLLSLLFVVDALYDSDDVRFAVLDEPELSLHPAILRRLAEALVDLTRDRQIIVATHSPYFASLEAIAGGAEVARVHQVDGFSRVSRLQPSTSQKLATFLGNLNNPHVLGLDAREVFFLDDRVVLVEGQEDVVFYRRMLDSMGQRLSGSFYGWGVGGASNMALVAAMLRDLGFSRVLGILDGDQGDTRAALAAEFPQYRFEMIPAPDVRTKAPTKPRAAVRGLMDEGGQVRQEYHADMKGLLDRANDYLDGAKGTGASSPTSQ